MIKPYLRRSPAIIRWGTTPPNRQIRTRQRQGTHQTACPHTTRASQICVRKPRWRSNLRIRLFKISSHTNSNSSTLANKTQVLATTPSSKKVLANSRLLARIGSLNRSYRQAIKSVVSLQVPLRKTIDYWRTKHHLTTSKSPSR